MSRWLRFRSGARWLSASWGVVGTAIVLAAAVLSLTSTLSAAPAEAADGGYWKLVEGKPFKDEGTHQCYPTKVAVSDGSIVGSQDLTCVGGNGPGKFGTSYSWNKPPSTLTPGQKFGMTISGNITAKDSRGLFLGGYLEAGFDQHNLGPSSVTRSHVKIAEISLDVNDPKKQSASQAGEVVVPSHGFADSSRSNRMQMKVGGQGPGTFAYTYIYEWVAGGQAAPPQQPAVSPPCSPEDMRQAIREQLDQYLNQFSGSTFTHVVVIGNRERFYRALDETDIAIGALPSALGQYDASSNTLTFASNPCEKRDTDMKQTIYHELMHKIEVDNWDRWAAENLFGDVFGYDPFGWKEYADRHTYYTTQLVRQPLNLLADIERRAKGGATVDELSPLWDRFVADMDKGASGLNSYTNVPELDRLNLWIGFSADVDEIKALYAGGEAGPTLQWLMQMKYPDEMMPSSDPGDYYVPEDDWYDEEIG